MPIRRQWSWSYVRDVLADMLELVVMLAACWCVNFCMVLDIIAATWDEIGDDGGRADLERWRENGQSCS